MPELLKSQKAALFEWIKGGNFSPALFDLTPESDVRGKVIGNRLRYKDSHYYFTIESRDAFHLSFSPGKERLREEMFSRSFENIVFVLADWLNCLEKEISAPDPWGAISEYSTLAQIAPAPDIPNTAFTYPELEAIWKGLTAIQSTLLIHAGESGTHQALVNSQIAFLIESSKRMGRKDWLLIAIGSFVTIASAMSLSPEIARQLFHQLQDAVNGIIHIAPLLA